MGGAIRPVGVQFVQRFQIVDQDRANCVPDQRESTCTGVVIL